MTGYFCPLCNRDHHLNSKVGKEHYLDYLVDLEERDRRADEERSSRTPLTEEEVRSLLYRAIYGKE